MSEPSLNQEELKEESRATLREIAGVLRELRGLRGSDLWDESGSNLEPDVTRTEGATRISDMLHEAQERLDRIAGDLEHKGLCME